MSSSLSTNAGNKIEHYCRQCGGTDLMSDAPCSWDVEKQEWVKCGEVYDNTYCRNCSENVKTDIRPHVSDAAIAEAVRWGQQAYVGSGAWSGCLSAIIRKAEIIDHERS